MSGRVRVLRIIARLNIGGPALHATLLAERLDPGRYDSLLVAGPEGPREGNYLELVGRSVPALRVVPELGREIRVGPDLRALVALVRLMRQWRPHVVHTHTAKAGTLGRLAAWWAGVPVVVHTYHGHVLRAYFGRAKGTLFLAVERWLARRTDRLLAVSDTVRHELLDLGIGSVDRFEVVPLGLDLEGLLGCDRLRGELRRELGIRGEVLLVGIVARLVPIKAHEVFLEGAARLAGALGEVEFLVVGDGAQRRELEELGRRLGIADRVRFLGWRRDLERVYADLDVVVLTSRNEGLPVSLIEAMAAGRAIVATRVGGVPDLVRGHVTGELVPPDDGGALADAVGSLLRDPERRRRLGEAARGSVYPAFGAERLLGDVDRLYAALLWEKLRA